MFSCRILAFIVPAFGLAYAAATELQAFEHTVAGYLVAGQGNRPANRLAAAPVNRFGFVATHLPRAEWDTVFDATFGHHIGPARQLGDAGTLSNFYPFANGFRISTGLLYRQEYTSQSQRKADPFHAGGATLFQPGSEQSVDNLDLYFGVGFDVQLSASARSVTFDFGVASQWCDYCGNENKTTTDIIAGKKYTYVPWERINGWRRQFQPVLRFKVRYKF